MSIFSLQGNHIFGQAPRNYERLQFKKKKEKRKYFLKVEEIS